jgi:HAD superfamily hydrolase (TIGR01490 family)
MKQLTIFDLDNTILKGDSDYSWIKYMIDSGFVDKDKYTAKNNYFYEQYEKGLLDFNEYTIFALSTIKGKSVNDINNLMKGFMEKIIEPMINIYILKILHDHNHNNDEMLLASATNSAVVNPIAKRLGFNNVIATEVEIIDGVYSGKVQDIPALGEGKLQKVREWMSISNIHDFKNTTFYSDSINDFPLLSVVKNPVDVNPDDKLRKECQKRAWEIIDLP